MVKHRLTWKEPSYPNDRRVAIAGHVPIGAVFPPIPAPGKWRWRLFIRSFEKEGDAKTELAAKNALTAAWLDFARALGFPVDEETT